MKFFKVFTKDEKKVSGKSEREREKKEKKKKLQQCMKINLFELEKCSQNKKDKGVSNKIIFHLKGRKELRDFIDSITKKILTTLTTLCR